MQFRSRCQRISKAALALVMVALSAAGAWAQNGPRSAEELARLYMDAFNKKDAAALDKLRYPTKAKSEMQDMLDQIASAEMESGTKYTKFEVKEAPADGMKPAMGPDGKFYKPNLKPTNIVKMIAVSESGTSSTSFPVGVKDGIYYLVSIEPDEKTALPYRFGWQRFTPPGATWSVLMPNEPEPGRAAIEFDGGPNALKDPDAYGVVRNTAEIKTTQHFFLCGEEGKRRHAEDNKETYRVACTTYSPETLSKWFADVKKNLDEAVDYRVRSEGGKLVQQAPITLNGAPGREYEIREADGSLLLGRVYWIKDAMYELSFNSAREKPDRDGARKFLDSLEVK